MELEEAISPTLLNFKVWMKREVETTIWRSKDLPLKISIGVSELREVRVCKEAEEMVMNYQLIVYINYFC